MQELAFEFRLVCKADLLEAFTMYGQQAASVNLQQCLDSRLRLYQASI